MNDFKVIARLLAAIRAAELNPPFSVELVSEKALKTNAKTRDLLAIKLQNAGYIEGLIVSEDIDGAPLSVIWQSSNPAITLSGLEYIATCKPLNKAAAQIQEIDENVAAKVVQAQINTMVQCYNL